MGAEKSKPVTIEEATNLTQLSKEEVNAIMAEFKKVSGDSALDYEKFCQVATSVNVYMPNPVFTDRFLLQKIFNSFDTNHSGRIDMTEFLLGLSVLSRGNKEEIAELVFRSYDLNNDGFLDIPELQRMMEKIYSGWLKILKSILDEETKDMGFLERAIVKGTAGLIFNAIGGAAQTELVQQMLQADENNDRKLSLDEWKRHATTNEAIGHIIDFAAKPKELEQYK